MKKAGAPRSKRGWRRKNTAMADMKTTVMRLMTGTTDLKEARLTPN